MKIDMNQGMNLPSSLPRHHDQTSSAFENLLNSPAGQMSEGQYHLSRLDQLEQSALEFKAAKSQPQAPCTDQLLKNPNSKEKTAESPLSLKESEVVSASPLHLIIKSDDVASSKMLSNTFLLIKKRIQDLPGFNSETRTNLVKESKRPNPVPVNLNYTAKACHQKYQLYLQKDGIELSLNTGDLPDDELIRFISNLKSHIQKKGLRLTLLMINGVKQ